MGVSFGGGDAVARTERTVVRSRRRRVPMAPIGFRGQRSLWAVQAGEQPAAARPGELPPGRRRARRSTEHPVPIPRPIQSALQRHARGFDGTDQERAQQLRRSETATDTPAPSNTDDAASAESDGERRHLPTRRAFGAQLLQYLGGGASERRPLVLDISEEQKDGSVASSLNRMSATDLGGLDIVSLTSL
jgi:hypothetical protein